jgi:5-methyltetrahydropteroyltriglutamate--homocysteine methyltransferase
MVKSACFGMPRIGTQKELITAMADFAAGKISENELQTVAKNIRSNNWQMQLDAGIDLIPCNDFSLYDQILDTTVLLGNIPKRYYWEGGSVSLDIYLAMINGQQKDKFDAKPMARRRWFNSEYLYILPELSDPIEFAYSDNKSILHYLEAKQQFKITTRPIFFGPISYLLMCQIDEEDEEGVDLQEALEELMLVYEELFQNLSRLSVAQIVFEEPMLTSDLTLAEQNLYKSCYAQLGKFADVGGIEIHLSAPYGTIGHNLECTLSLPIKSLHIDLINYNEDINQIIDHLPAGIGLSLGVVDAKNVWINNLEESIKIVKYVASKIGSDRVVVAPSSSFFECPLNLELENNIPSQLDGKLAFVKQKLEELAIICKAVNSGEESVAKQLEQNRKHYIELQDIVGSFTTSIGDNCETVARLMPFNARKELQKNIVISQNLPIMMQPFFCNNEPKNIFSLTDELKEKIINAIQFQKDHSMDVAIYGEFDRSSNIEYFSACFNGFFIPQNSFVQINGGSAVVKPILFEPISPSREPYLEIAKFVADNCPVQMPMKFSAIGPITLVNSSFCLPLVNQKDLYAHACRIMSEQYKKIEQCGIKMLHLDESVLLMNMPRRHQEIIPYLRTVADIFKSTMGLLQNETQVHVFVGFYPFEEYIENLSRLDYDVLLLSNANTNGKIFESFISYRYQADLGLGVFEPNSDRMPTKVEVGIAVKKLRRVLDDNQIWITCDSGFASRTQQQASTALNIINDILAGLRKSAAN